MLTPAILKRPSVVLTLFVLILPGFVRAQSGAKNGEWPTYGGDLGNTRYSALDQINADNFNKLQIAWRFKTDHQGPRPEFQLESTPLMVQFRSVLRRRFRGDFTGRRRRAQLVAHVL